MKTNERQLRLPLFFVIEIPVSNAMLHRFGNLIRRLCRHLLPPEKANNVAMLPSPV
jgi:hypothetical protein